MLLEVLLASLVANTFAYTSPSLKNSSPLTTTINFMHIDLSSLIESIPILNTSENEDEKTRKGDVSSVAPLEATLSTTGSVNETSKNPESIKLAASSPLSIKHATPSVLISTTSKSSNAKKHPQKSNSRTVLHVSPLISVLRDPSLDGRRNYNEPEDFQNALLYQEELLANPPNERNIKSEHFLQEIKEKLRRSNEDYLQKLSGRRRGSESMNRIVHSKKKNDLNMKESHRRELPRKRHKVKTNNVTEASSDAVSPVHWTGLTKPGKYEIKSHRKQHKKHKRKRRVNPKKPRSRYIGPRPLRGKNLKTGDLKSVHQDDVNSYAQRRNEEMKTDVSTIENQTSKTTTATEETPHVMLQPINKLPSSKRAHSYPRPKTYPSVVTRPSLYDIVTVTTRVAPSLMWGQHFSTTPAIPTNAQIGAGLRTSGRSLTTPSGFEIESARKERKLEKFVKFIKKNRSLLRQYMDIKHKKTAERMEKKGFFRGDTVLRAVEPVHGNRMDLSPAKGNQIERMRGKHRVCQRHVMIPEGPKYNSRGHSYMPAFKNEKDQPDYPATKMKKFMLPVCCNCCRKSVLGCQ